MDEKQRLTLTLESFLRSDLVEQADRTRAAQGSLFHKLASLREDLLENQTKAQELQYV